MEGLPEYLNVQASGLPIGANAVAGTNRPPKGSSANVQ